MFLQIGAGVWVRRDEVVAISHFESRADVNKFIVVVHVKVHNGLAQIDGWSFTTKDQAISMVDTLTNSFLQCA